MRITHVTPAFYPAHIYGGPSQSVYHLCRAIKRHGGDVRVLTTNANGWQRGAVLNVATDREMILEDDLPVRYCARIAVNSKSLDLLKWLPHYARWSDVIHITAVYSFPIIPALAIAKLYGKSVVWSPRGMLQRWDGTSRTTIKTVWEKICCVAAPRKLVLHVTSEMEAEACRERMPGIEICVIPNGADVETRRQTDESIKGNNNGHHKQPMRVLFIGRLHQKKGIENLLAALDLLRVKDAKPVVGSVVIAGTGDADYVQSIQNLINRFGLQNQVKMIGEVTGEEKNSVYDAADVVVIPSHVENFGIVVAEALARGIPVIASRGTPWQRVEEANCGLWVDNDPATLAAALEKIHTMPRAEMGARGRELIKREYSWDAIGESMMRLYHRIAAAKSSA